MATAVVPFNVKKETKSNF